MYSSESELFRDLVRVTNDYLKGREKITLGQVRGMLKELSRIYDNVLAP